MNAVPERGKRSCGEIGLLRTRLPACSLRTSLRHCARKRGTYEGFWEVMRAARADDEEQQEEARQHDFGLGG